MSLNTIRAYKYSIEEFENHTQTPLEDTTPAHVKAYIKHLTDTEKSPSTIQARIAALSSLFDWAVTEFVINRNPAHGIRLPKIPKRYPDYIPRIDLMERIDAINGDDFTSLRDRAIVETAYSGGMRESDIRNANRKDLDIAGMRLKVLGKGNKERFIPIGEYAAQALEKYLAQRDKDRLGLEEPALFVNAYGERLQTPGKIVKKHLGAAPHTSCRASAATHLLIAGASASTIQELLGHAHISTTERYFGRHDQHFRDQFNARHPRARLQRGI